MTQAFLPAFSLLGAVFAALLVFNLLRGVFLLALQLTQAALSPSTRNTSPPSPSASDRPLHHVFPFVRWLPRSQFQRPRSP